MPSLYDSLTYQPQELKFGTSGLRDLVVHMTDLECYINTGGFLRFLRDQGQITTGSTIYLAGDLRDSTPRILRAVHQAITDGGYVTNYQGLVPTPTVAYYALQRQAPCIMVTGSHIPADRNGIKFYRADGEVLKADEAAIKTAVVAVRSKLYDQDANKSAFAPDGTLRSLLELAPAKDEAATLYKQRYLSVFDDATLRGKKIIFYQHSAVGRDLLPEILRGLGADVKTVGRSDVFVPIDTENVTPEDQAYFHQLANDNPDAFAIVSTDGDSDRPFVIDEKGVFNRGDVLGAVAADILKADFAAFPISSSDAVTTYLDAKGVPWMTTKIGSPYVVVAMSEAFEAGKQHVVGWEVNGGLLLGSDVTLNGQLLLALPTRDALLPIILALVAATQAGSVSEVFAALPQRFSQAGLLNDFPVEVSQRIISRFASDTPAARHALEQHFTPALGFGQVKEINSQDGVRIYFDNGDIAHLRPSGNAPQLRIYSVADSQRRADEVVAMALHEPDGIFRQLERDLAQ